MPTGPIAMSGLAGLPFRKMNGLGNDFVIVDLRRAEATMAEDAARLIADRKTGIGCDQVITIEDHDGPFMGVWNADGSPSGACGNAARCVGWLLMEETGETEVGFGTASGDISAARVGDRRIAVDMGKPRLGWREIPLAEQMDDTRFIDIKLGPIDKPVLWGPSAVNMGNPHCIFFVEDAEAQALDRFGPMVENYPLFPARHCFGGGSQKPTPHSTARLGTRRRHHQGLRNGCLRGACCGSSTSPDGAQSDHRTRWRRPRNRMAR